MSSSRRKRSNSPDFLNLRSGSGVIIKDCSEGERTHQRVDWGFLLAWMITQILGPPGHVG